MSGIRSTVPGSQLRVYSLVFSLFSLLLLCNCRAKGQPEVIAERPIDIEQDVDVLCIIEQDKLRLDPSYKPPLSKKLLSDRSITYVPIVSDLIKEFVYDPIVRDRLDSETKSFHRLLDESRDLDFRKEFFSSLRSTLAEAGIFSIVDFTVTHVSKRLDPSDTRFRGLLRVEPKYFLANRDRTFVIMSTVSFYRRGSRNPESIVSLVYLSRPIECARKDDECRNPFDAWAVDDASRYRCEFGQGISETLRMLKLDLQQEAAPDLDQVVGSERQPRILETKNGRVVARTESVLLLNPPIQWRMLVSVPGTKAQ